VRDALGAQRRRRLRSRRCIAILKWVDYRALSERTFRLAWSLFGAVLTVAYVVAAALGALEHSGTRRVLILGSVFLFVPLHVWALTGEVRRSRSARESSGLAAVVVLLFILDVAALWILVAPPAI
jgi:hypothetical protein